ncbi:DUF2264 domain-containing protein [Pontiellaceae bacterium B12227]|nr:DUF2264 domain-containing protein [Pontiellaceae bacterium B12227]
MAYQIQNPDYTLSPETGMTRQHWIDAGTYLLEGIFKHIPTMDDPIVLPKQSDVIYPKADDPAWRFKAEEYEGLSRTFLLAAPLISAKPDLECNGYNVADYYAHQLLLATDKTSERYLGTTSELIEEYGPGWYQHTCEGAALAISLMNSKEQIWDKYTQEEKDQIAAFLSDYAHSKTLSHNWRFFNVMLLTFLRVNGYEVDDGLLQDHLQHIMALYCGDGWYRDLGFDYYTPWGFHFYAPIWCKWYGNEHEPELAKIIDQRHAEFMQTYPLMFSREGHQIMYGRSIIYRFAASAALGTSAMVKDSPVDFGWMRRIASANLMQFVGRDDFYTDEGVPCLGYYGPWDPMVQFYSCAASPFWMAKAFVCLTLPEDSPFWTATENNGEWDEIDDGFKTVTLPGPGLTITADGKTGTSTVQMGKIKSSEGYNNLPPYYSRLAFNSDFPWEDDNTDGAVPQQYCAVELDYPEDFLLPYSVGTAGERDGVVYRHVEVKAHHDVPGRFDLADIVVPGGLLRVDRQRLSTRHEVSLGHYGLPHIDGLAAKVEKRTVNGCECLTASIPGRQVAMVALAGWDGLDHLVHTGKHPEAADSTVIFAKRRREEHYQGMPLLVTLMLQKTDDTPWTDEELSVVKSYKTVSWFKSGQPLGAEVELNDGRSLKVDFGHIEGNVAY